MKNVIPWNVRNLCERLDNVNSELNYISSELDKMEQESIAALCFTCSRFVEELFVLTSKIR